MFCPFCSASFDGDENVGICPDCGGENNSIGEWRKRSSCAARDDGHHETGSDASEGDFLLYDMEDDEF
jgi:predicted amidophosphoribosyltransferase